MKYCSYSLSLKQYTGLTLHWFDVFLCVCQCSYDSSLFARQVLLEPVSMWCCGNVFDKACITTVFRMKTHDNTSKCPTCRKPFFTLPQVHYFWYMCCKTCPLMNKTPRMLRSHSRVFRLVFRLAFFFIHRLSRTSKT